MDLALLIALFRAEVVPYDNVEMGVDTEPSTEDAHVDCKEMKVSKSVLLHMQAKLRRQLNKDIRKLNVKTERTLLRRRLNKLSF